MTHGHFHWNELMTRDPEGAKSFYSQTIGWTFNDMPMPDGTYHVSGQKIFITVNIPGIKYFIIFAWAPSIGCGMIACCANIDAPTIAGRM